MSNTYIENLNKQVDETKHLLMQNCEKIIDRGENLEELDNKAVALSLSSHGFKKNTRKLKNKMWCQQKIYLCIPLFLFIIIIIIAIVRTNKS